MTKLNANFVLSFLTLLVIIVCCLFTLPVTSANTDDDIINPNWKRPSLWNRHHNHHHDPEQQQCSECPPVEPCPPCEDQQPSAPPPVPETCQQKPCELEFRLFQKFLRRLFDRKRLHKDFESDYLLGQVQLKITEHQLDMLLQAKNIRELDGIVSSVVEQSEGGDAGYFARATESFCWSVGELFRVVGTNGYFLYVFVPTLGLLGVYWLVKVNARIMGIHPLVALLLMALLMSYFITYRDCNRRLEADALAKLSFSDGANPCKQRAQRGTGFSGWISDFLVGDSEARCREYLQRHSTETTINICDPSTVFIEMVAKLQMHYFESFIKNMVSIFKNSTAGSGMIGTILIGLFICMLLYILVTTAVKYGLYGWFNFLGTCITGGNRPAQHHPTNALPPNEQQQQQLPITLNINLNHPGGRITSTIDTNRIEEIAEPKPKLALEAATSLASNEEDGSGDGPKILTEKLIAGEATKGELEEKLVKDVTEADASDNQKEETVGP